jgi:hypothetical protein
MTAIINKGYKPNMTMDMIGACLAHYKKQNRPVEAIELHPDKWNEFKKGILELKPEFEDDLNHFGECQFKNVTVKKGSSFMVKSLVVTLRELVYDESYIAKQKLLSEQN